MGWVSKEIRSTNDIFNDLIKEFGEKWDITRLPHGNGSAYEYFSDYIRDYYEITLQQCDVLCKMLKEHYNIKKFYARD